MGHRSCSTKPARSKLKSLPASRADYICSTTQPASSASCRRQFNSLAVSSFMFKDGYTFWQHATSRSMVASHFEATHPYLFDNDLTLWRHAPYLQQEFCTLATHTFILDGSFAFWPSQFHLRRESKRLHLAAISGPCRAHIEHANCAF